MKLGRKTILGLVVFFAGAVVAAAYMFDAKTGAQSAKSVGELALPPGHPPLPTTQAEAKAAAPAAGKLVLPPSHPPIAVPPPGANARQGRVAVDETRPFTHYRVGNNSVIALYADGDVMWLGTSGGLVRYDTNSREFRTFDTGNGLRSNGILFLGKLRGRIAAGTYGGGLALFDQESQSWENFGSAEGLADAYVYDAYEAPGGDIWIATGSGINRVRGGALKDRARWESFTVESTSGALTHNRIFRIVPGQDGALWFATRGGLSRLSRGKWESWTPPSPPLKENSSLGQSAAAEGSAKVASLQNVPAVVARQAERKPPVDPAHIAALEVGRDGKVWAGTRGGGLARFDGKAWHFLTQADGLPSNQVSSLSIDANGILWVGTTAGLARYHNGHFKVMTPADGLLGENVYSVAATRNGELWVGGMGGVAHFRRAGSP